MSRAFKAITTADTRDIPWYPDWTIKGTCLHYPPAWFYDYGRNKKKIDRAKWVCNHCPVKIRCASENLNIPFGIFGGMTWLERWRYQGNTGYPDRTGAYKSFAEFSRGSEAGSNQPPTQNRSRRKTQKKSSARLAPS